jgi:6-pyruvoyltetrahydropterin/6-carboxytetrahydropterin synthase
MKIIRITKEFTFEMAHALKDYDGKCENIHGHSYSLSVTVIGEVADAAGKPKDGMVIDFGDLKQLVHEKILVEFDHALVINENDPRKDALRALNTRLVFTPYQPTSENLLLDFVRRLSGALDGSVKLHSLRLRETSSSFSEWFADDN